MFLYKERNLNIDIIRILAILMIVTSHVSGIIYMRPDFFGKPFWWVNHIILSFSRLGTPLFFMISGYLLADRKRSIIENLRHTIKRLLIPFIVFYVLSNLVFSNIHNTRSFDNLLSNIFIGGGNYLYFLIGLIFLYLINPIIQKTTVQLTADEFKKLIGFLLINTGLYALGAYILSKNGQINFDTFIYWFLTLGFFLYGHYLKKHSQVKINNILVFLLTISMIVFNILVSFISQKIYLQTNNIWLLKISHYFQSYLGLTVIIASVSLFRLLLLINIPQSLLQKISPFIITLSVNSFGIYLVHLIVLEYFLFRTPLTIDNGPFNPAIMIVIIWLMLVISSYFFTVIVRKIPYLKLIVGES